MDSKYTHMVIINLHETDYIKEVLVALSEDFVRETTVVDAEGIVSRHGNHYPNISSLLNIFKESQNQNYQITAVVQAARVKSLKQRLKCIKMNDRYVSSFWFIPIEGFVYHKNLD